jgi:hypothetical protein
MEAAIHQRKETRDMDLGRGRYTTTKGCEDEKRDVYITSLYTTWSVSPSGEER